MVAYVVVRSYKATGCNVFSRVQFLDSHLQFFPENLGAVGVFTGLFPPPKNSTKANGVPECWLFISEHLEEKPRRQKCSRKSSTVIV